MRWRGAAKQNTMVVLDVNVQLFRDGYDDEISGGADRANVSGKVVANEYSFENCRRCSALHY